MFDYLVYMLGQSSPIHTILKNLTQTPLRNILLSSDWAKATNYVQ